jgi:type II secretory pathway pseudopilin PulG
VTPPSQEQPGRRHSWRWAVLALLAAVAASTLTTALAAAVAGRQSDLALQPVELALRVAVLLVAPCVGAVLAAVVVPVRSAGAAPGTSSPTDRGTPSGFPGPLRPDPAGRSPGGRRLAVAAVGLGVPVGPLLVLRLDQVRQFGLPSSLLTLGVLLAWGVVGAALAAGWWARPGRRVERTDLPLAPGLADPVEAGGDPGPHGPAA